MHPIPFVQKVPVDILYNQQGFLQESVQWHGPIACVQAGCQRILETLIFSSSSVIHSFFSFITFHCTHLYYPSTMSALISEHLQSSLSTVLTSPLPFLLYSFICFSNISVGWTPKQTLPTTPMSIFIFIFLSSFYHVSPLCLGSWFLFHIWS